MLQRWRYPEAVCSFTSECEHVNEVFTGVWEGDSSSGTGSWCSSLDVCAQRPSGFGSEPRSTPMPSPSSSQLSLACCSSTGPSWEEIADGAPTRLESARGRWAVMILQGVFSPSWWSRCSILCLLRNCWNSFDQAFLITHYESSADISLDQSLVLRRAIFWWCSHEPVFVLILTPHGSSSSGGGSSLSSLCR